MKGACGMLVGVVRAMEEQFGPEVHEVLREKRANRTGRPEDQLGPPEEDLHAFCDRLEKGCTGSHEWERLVDEPGEVGYTFTACLWAEIFNELGATDIGWWWCEGDEPAVKAYHPRLGFRRTKTLMEGDDECDHIFLVED